MFWDYDNSQEGGARGWRALDWRLDFLVSNGKGNGRGFRFYGSIFGNFVFVTNDTKSFSALNSVNDFIKIILIRINIFNLIYTFLR